MLLYTIILTFWVLILFIKLTCFHLLMYGTLVFLLYKVGSKQVLYMYCEIINFYGLKKCVFLQQTFLMTLKYVYYKET